MAITLSQTASVYRSTGATTQTLSFTTVTDDTDLIVAIRTLDANAVTGVTFNGDSFTSAAPTQKQGTSSDYLSYWRLSNPSVTTADITISLSSSRRVIIMASSYQGTDGGASEDNDGTNGAGTSATLTMTSLTDNAWHIVAVIEDSAVYSSLTNITIDVTENTIAFAYLGHHEATTAGSVTQTFTWSGASQYAINGFVMVPGASAPTNTGFLSLL